MKKILILLLAIIPGLTKPTNAAEQQEPYDANLQQAPRSFTQEQRNREVGILINQSQAILHNDFDPEQRYDEEDEKLAKIVHRLLELLTAEDQREEPINFQAGYQNPDPIQQPSELLNNNQGIGNQPPQRPAISEQMVLECAKAWTERGRNYETPEELAAFLIRYSQLRMKNWSEEACGRIANHLINLDDL